MLPEHLKAVKGLARFLEKKKNYIVYLIVLISDSTKRVRKTKKSMKLAQSKNQVRTGQVTSVKAAGILLFCSYSLW